MSSDYLNYTTSKELKELGVEFDNPTKAYYGYTEDYLRGIDPDTIDQRMVIELGLYHIGSFENAGICVAPSTAQIIDKLLEYDEVLTIFSYGQSCCLRLKDETKATTADNKCATTALGQALITLVKGEKNK